MSWYLFTPPIEEIKDPTNPKHYSLYGNSAPPTLKGNKKMYALNATANPENGLPQISDALINEMFIAMIVKKGSTNILLKKK